MLATLGALASAALGRKRGREKKEAPAQAVADFSGARRLSQSDADDESPRRASSRATPLALRGRGGATRCKIIRVTFILSNKSRPGWTPVL